MAKSNKKVLGIGLAGVMSVGAIAGAVSAINNNQASAATSQAYKTAVAYIEDTEKSIRANYGNITNQVVWEGYLAKARHYIAQMPASESAEAAQLVTEADNLQDYVNSAAKLNHVERSWKENYHGIKNVDQWNEYLDESEELMKKLDSSEFPERYAELVERHNAMKALVKGVEDAHYADLAKVQEKFDAAKKSMSLADAEAALADAKKLGTHSSSAAIVKEIEDFIAQLNENLTVTDITVANPKNLKLEGTGLNKLKLEDITVDNNKVKSIKVSDDLKSLNIELENEILPNFDTKVTVKVNGEDKVFTINNKVEVKEITVNDQTFAHDVKGQFITFNINGQPMTADYLKAAGYDIKFVATKNGAASKIFPGGTSGVNNNVNSSTTGELAGSINVETAPHSGGENKVEVQVIKNGSIVVSTEAKITVVNMNQAATKINKVTLLNERDGNHAPIATGTPPTGYDTDPTINAGSYKMNSNTLVTGEIVSINEVMADINGDDTLAPKAVINVTNPDSRIISVNKDATTGVYTLKAQSPGTATVTVKIGNAEHKMNITVTNTKRSLAKVDFDRSALTVSTINTDATEVKIKTLDQYGDPIAITKNNADITPPIANGTGKWIDATATNIGNKNIRMDIGTVDLGSGATAHKETVVSAVGALTTAGTGAGAGNSYTPYDAVGAPTTPGDSDDEILTDGSNGPVGEQTLKFYINTAILKDTSSRITFYDYYRNPNTNIASRNVIGTLPVNITANNTISSVKVDVATVTASSLQHDGTTPVSDHTIYSKDLKLDLEDDMLVRLKVDGYNSAGINLGSQDLYEKGSLAAAGTTAGTTDAGTYYVFEVLNKDVAEVNTTPAFKAGNKFVDIKGKAKGTTEVAIRKVTIQATGDPETEGVYMGKAVITVEENKAEITKVDFKAPIAPVTNYSNKVELKELMYVTASDNDPIIGGITLSTGSTAKVRLSKQDSTAHSGTGGTSKPGTDEIWMNDLYLDIDGDGKYNDGTAPVTNGKDKIIGSIVVEGTTDPDSVGKVSDIVNNSGATTTAGITADRVLANFVAQTPADSFAVFPMNGNVILKVIGEGQSTGVGKVDESKAIGTTQFKVEVKVP